MNKDEHLKDIQKAISKASEYYTASEIGRFIANDTCLLGAADAGSRSFEEPYKRLATWDNFCGYRVGDLRASPSRLVEVFGRPTRGGSDVYKVSGEYYFQDKEKNVFYIYDWKQTSLYDKDYPTPKCFWSFDGKVELGIGGNGNGSVINFQSWLIDRLKEDDDDNNKRNR